MTDELDPAALRDAAIALAVEHADDVEPRWSDVAYGLLLQVIQLRKRTPRCETPFMAEDVRRWAERTRGLPSPPDARAWGGVFQRAARAKVIERAGFGESRNPQAHLRPTALWRAL